MKKVLALLAFAIFAVINTVAQEHVDSAFNNVMLAADSMARDVVNTVNDDMVAPVKLKQKKQKRDWATWRPDVKRATWLAIVIPGGGQIYNRKYWKLPIVYGGFVGCIYALRWNGMMYDTYSKAYIDIMDDDPETKSYENMLQLGSVINDSNIDKYKEVFRKRKDRFRRWRDLSFFCILGVYGLSIIDAYVDASLSEFDISDDLSLKVTPAYINGQQKNMMASRSALGNGGLGVRCKLNF